MPHRDLRPNRPAWLFGKTVLKAFYCWYLRMKVEGEDNVPSEGPLLLVSNHQSNLDPVAIGVACHREINFLAKQELFRIPVVATLIRGWGAIPIDRGATDTAAMRAAMRVVRQGKILGIFPEGTRSTTGEMRAFREGVAKIAVRFRLPIVPVAVDGTYRALPRGAWLPRPVPIVVRFGPAFTLAGLGDANSLSQFAEMIRERIASLLLKAP